MVLAAIGSSGVEFSLGQYLIPGLVLLLFFAILLIIKVMVSRYRKIPPNKVAIIYGRGTKVAGPAGGQIQGCKVVSGGGVLVWPVVQEIAFMDTAVFKMEIRETDIPNKDNVKISVKGVAICKISTTPEDLQSAAMSFLGKDQRQIEDTISATLIGHVRSIIGKLDINGILRDRDEFNKMVVTESTAELKRMGIQVVTLVIQEVNDEHGYIDALGKKTVAQAVRDANIMVAEAEAETTKRVSTAKKEAAVVEAQNAVAVAEAEKNRDVQKATFKAAADTEKAKADQALAIATAVQQQTLRVAEAARDAAAAEAQIAVQEKEAQRKEKQLIVEVIRPAEAQRNAAVITADGQRQAAVIVADANKQTAVIEADGSKQAAVLQAEASKEVAVRKAQGDAEAAETLGKGQASQTLATMTAQAEGTRLNLLAKAEGDKANLLAQAEGAAAQKGKVLMAEAEGQAALKGKVLLAEAEGTAKLAEALAKMTESARMILIMDRLPGLMDHGGEALAKALHSVFGPIAAGVANIDNITITDIGGTGRGLTQVGNLVPKIVSDFVVGLRAQGVDVEKMLSKVGANPAALVKLLEATPPAATPDAEPPAPAVEPSGKA
jgi:flotillin